MTKLNMITAMACALHLSGCAAGLNIPKFNFDTANSGKLADQEFQILHLGGEDKDDGDGTRSKLLPDAISDHCVPTGNEASIAGPFNPLVLALANVAIDNFFAAADNRRAELKEAAIKGYSGTLVENEFGLFGGECIALIRTTEGAVGSVIVLQVQGFSADNTVNTAFVLRPIYVYVPKAAAQTAIVNGAAQVKVEAAITVAMALESPTAGREIVQSIISSNHTFEAIELGTHYVRSGIDLGFEAEALKASDGPLFAWNEDVITVGVISAAVKEYGTASTLSGPDTTEKAARTAYKSAIGSILEEELSD